VRENAAQKPLATQKPGQDPGFFLGSVTAVVAQAALA
jgi:hypothetical protein